LGPDETGTVPALELGVTRLVIPASIPTAFAVRGMVAGMSSHSIETNQRPAASCDTVTVDGAAPSGRGRDQTMFSGSLILARVSLPSRKRKPLVVYSADFRDFFRDLKTGYLARFSQKFANAPCRCRSVCCNGTDDTSDRKASSSDFFHEVSIAEVAL
jgi:hypothetical protein